MPDIRFTKEFRKQYKRAPKKVQQACDQRLLLFFQEPRHPLLRNHLLSGNLRSYRSISVTGDWRAIYKEMDDRSMIVFLLLGTHSELYK